MACSPHIVTAGILIASLWAPSCSSDPGPVAPTAPPPGGGIQLARGPGSFMFDGYEPLASKPIRVWYYSPRAVPSELPIVIILHGNSRNGDDYRDAWIGSAEEHLVLVIAPEFDDGFFPGSQGYAQGNVFDANNNAVSEELWTFSYIEPLFDYVKELAASSAEEYAIFGHSAGSQFVHRFLLFKPDLRVDKAVAANAGWYTMPDLSETFPYGLRQSGLADAALNAFLEQPLIVLLGERDTNPNDPSLRQTRQARAQGRHRFARGMNFFSKAESSSAEQGVSLNWQIETVPNVGHNQARMAGPAAQLLFEK